jgi:response regulator RpfG family c-di-GMP phosphodiesterase
MLSQIGCMALPAATNEKLYYGKPLSAAEVELTKQLPTLAVQLLDSIPRLDAVKAILQAQEYDYCGTRSPSDVPKGDAIPQGARVLRIVSDYDSLEAAKADPMHAIATMQAAGSRYDPTLLEAFAGLKNRSASKALRDLALAAVRPGMFLAQDVTSTKGVLLVPRGHEVTAGLLQRLRNFAA